VERGATIADLASEFLARESGSAEAGSSVVVVPTPTDQAGIRTSARGSRNGGKLVADAHHNHDTVLSRGHAGRRVNSAYAPGAHGNALGRTTGSSPLRSEQDGILCISSGVLRYWFLGVYASTPQALKLHKKRIQVVHRTCNAEDAIEFETEW